MNRVIQSSSKWGNLYRHRFYIDGRRVREDEFDRAQADIAKSESEWSRTPMENTQTGFRIVWDREV